MNSTTRTRKTTRPVSDRFATSRPQLAPISSCDISSGVAFIVVRMVSTTFWESSVVSCLVWTIRLLAPDVVTTGDEAPSMPVPATASRRASASSWVTVPSVMVSLYCAPPTNSMPMFRPLKYRPRIAVSTMRPEMAYQSRRRPTKLIDFLPV